MGEKAVSKLLNVVEAIYFTLLTMWQRTEYKGHGVQINHLQDILKSCFIAKMPLALPWAIKIWFVIK